MKIFIKDRTTLIEQSFTKTIRKYFYNENFYHENFLHENKANYGTLLSNHT